MKSFLDLLRSRPAVFSLAIFLGMILPALLLFPAAEQAGPEISAGLLGLVILANLAAIFLPSSG